MPCRPCVSPSRLGDCISDALGFSWSRSLQPSPLPSALCPLPLLSEWVSSLRCGSQWLSERFIFVLNIMCHSLYHIFTCMTSQTGKWQQPVTFLWRSRKQDGHAAIQVPESTLAASEHKLPSVTPMHTVTTGVWIELVHCRWLWLSLGWSPWICIFNK